MTFRRDALLASTARRWIIHRAFAGTTSVPLQLRPSEGPACQVRGAVSEGRACRVRCAMLEHLSRFFRQEMPLRFAASLRRIIS